ncbi:hypothetical protein P9112_008348 [Eukaryota sp. TZLM1-RC]
MNCNAVVSNSETCQKYHIGGPCLFPIVSIVDPSYQATLPWYQTVNGAIDVFAHLWEAYAMFVPCNKPITAIRYVESLMLATLDALEALHLQPEAYQPRADLCWAATLALNFSTTAPLNGGDWFTHMLEHAVSAVNTSVSHGAGLGVIIPAYWKFLVKHRPEQIVTLQRLAKNVFNVETIDEMCSAFKGLLRRYGHPTTLSEPISALGDTGLFNSVDASVKRQIVDVYHGRTGFYGFFKVTHDEAVEIVDSIC